MDRWTAMDSENSQNGQIGQHNGMDKGQMDMGRWFQECLEIAWLFHEYAF